MLTISMESVLPVQMSYTLGEMEILRDVPEA